MLLLTAIGFFALAAIFGMILISYVLSNKNTPKGISFIHGPFAAIGIVLLIICAFYYSSLWISAVLFIAAALGGFLLIYKDITGNSVPKWLAILHGLTAIIAFIFLLTFAFLAK